MRGSKIQGRFTVNYETLSIYEGIAEELGGTVGVEVDWWRWQDYYLEENVLSVVDDIYDVSSSVTGEGRRWMLPFTMPVVMAEFVRGGNLMNTRGFYTTDTLRLVINAGDAQRLLPNLLTNPGNNIKDRIVYRNQVFVPTRVVPRGSFAYNWAVITIDCNQVNSEELVNDPQFLKYATPTTSELRTIGYGAGTYGSDPYGE